MFVGGKTAGARAAGRIERAQKQQPCHTTDTRRKKNIASPSVCGNNNNSKETQRWLFDDDFGA